MIPMKNKTYLAGLLMAYSVVHLYAQTDNTAPSAASGVAPVATVAGAATHGTGSFLDDSENALGAIAGALGAERDAEKYVAEKGWSLTGTDDQGRFVTIGTADIASQPTNPNFQQARDAAFIKASLDAKEKVAMFFAQRILTETFYSSNQNAKNPDDFASTAASSPSRPPQLGIFDKIKLLIHADLDERLEKKGIDPSQATKEQVAEVEKAVLTTDLRRTVQRMAEAEVGALITQKIFEDGSAMAIVAYYNPNSRMLQNAILGKGPAPKGTPKAESIYVWANALSTADLYPSHGVQVRIDEHGDANIIAFGQAPVSINSGQGAKMAQTAAILAASGALRDFAGEFVEAQEKQDIVEHTKQYGEMDKALAQVTEDSQTRQKIHAKADALGISGATTIRTWTTKDVRSNRILTGAVIAWNLTTSQRANQDREAFSQSAGSKGGVGATKNLGNTPDSQMPTAGAATETYDPTKKTENKVESKEPDPF